MTATHFGFETVGEDEKTRRVRGVFDSVSARYDIMNDLMSLGLHRLWKACAVLAAHARPGDRVLDIAGGTGDLTQAFARQVGPGGCVWHTDINESMLRAGRERLINQGVLVPCALCDAEALPFGDGQFDLVSVAFGLRNMTHMDVALREMQRVLRVGGKLLVLEFSRVPRWLQKPYDWYSFGVLPALGQMVAGDAASYRYLAESVRRHPGQDELKALMHRCGFGHVHYVNLSAGICALHVGIRCAAGSQAPD